MTEAEPPGYIRRKPRRTTRLFVGDDSRSTVCPFRTLAVSSHYKRELSNGVCRGAVPALFHENHIKA